MKPRLPPASLTLEDSYVWINVTARYGGFRGNVVDMALRSDRRDAEIFRKCGAVWEGSSLYWLSAHGMHHVWATQGFVTTAGHVDIAALLDLSYFA